MKKTEKIVYLIASAMFMVTGVLQVDDEKDWYLPVLSFVVAGLLLYQSFGNSLTSSCSFKSMRNESKKMVAGDNKNLLTRNQAVKVALITFTAIVVCFGIGFGTGKLIYHFVH